MPVMCGVKAQIKLSECRRVVLFSLDAETQEVEMRHYLINASPVGLTRTVKKIIKAKIPDLNRFEDISDFVLGYASPLFWPQVFVCLAGGCVT
jgi:hypothetical protein